MTAHELIHLFLSRILFFRLSARLDECRTHVAFGLMLTYVGQHGFYFFIVPELLLESEHGSSGAGVCHVIVETFGMIDCVFAASASAALQLLELCSQPFDVRDFYAMHRADRLELQEYFAFVQLAIHIPDAILFEFGGGPVASPSR